MPAGRQPHSHRPLLRDGGRGVAPYPGFPTDAQAVVMSALLRSSGTTVFVENIFESRYHHVPELVRMGADIRLEGRVLSGRHVQGCPPHSTLWVPRETLITQLAADEARRRDICIRKET